MFIFYIRNRASMGRKLINENIIEIEYKKKTGYCKYLITMGITDLKSFQKIKEM